MTEAERLAFTLSPVRLRARQALFEAFTLPALDDQTDPDFRIVLITSDRLPPDYRARLNDLVRTRPYLSARAYPPTMTFEDSARDALAGVLAHDLPDDPDARAVHFRLDDDDALARDFIARLRAAATPLPAGHLISFTKGWYLRPDAGDSLTLAMVDYPKVSIGLSLVTAGKTPGTIHDLGNHYDIETDRVDLIGGAPAWVRSIHSAAESQTVRDPFEVHTRPEDRHHALSPAAVRAHLADTAPSLDPAAMRQALRLAEPVNPAARKNVPKLTLPKAEADTLRAAYKAARVILEYGSGGSTALAAGMPGKLIFSVESDPDWAIATQRYLDTADLPSPAILFPVDIGPTGAWGRPLNDRAWQRFPDYPLAIWDAPFFRHPDLILIDGRFRAACLATACLRITRPVTVLFDDYVNRPAYHVVEAFARPRECIGRMAVFDLVPQAYTGDQMAAMIRCFAHVSLARQGGAPAQPADHPSDQPEDHQGDGQ